ncbi:hypothetical protein T459_25861 [Capsicum annuum]|uniref:Uncharacterized protein n=1 Tax=Capsicum annuum TaxID=4072 RepID=A0A2G2YLY3_CAPAN|nr:hypothetical protein T459_25861 [Capsicum annuum]
MSSSKWVGNLSTSSAKQKEQAVDEINLGVRDMGLNSEQNDGWEVYARKPKNKGGKRGGKECSSQEYFSPAADYDKAGENDVEYNELDFIDESDDDLQYDDFDSDVTETSYEMCKKNRWFKQLLESRDSLTVTEINDSERQWHCPAWKVGPVGYIEVERLSEHFSEMGRDRDAWECHPVRFCPVGKLLLYGYMADKRDIDNFNQHSTGKSRLKFELRSYKGTFWKSAKQMRDDNQQLMWFKNKAKALEECLSLGRDNTKFIKLHDKEIEEFMEERVTLVQTHEYRIAALRCKHWEQEVEPERKVDLELAKQMEKYSSKQWHHVTKFLKYSKTIVFKFGTSAELWT